MLLKFNFIKSDMRRKSELEKQKVKINWSKSGLVRKETPDNAWCNLRLKSVFNESLGTYR